MTDDDRPLKVVNKLLGTDRIAGERRVVCLRQSSRCKGSFRVLQGAAVG